ncbi:hypothetical protein DACRYDRAFT_47027 [Dacryopinax primogenitus]|uniref:Type 1 phosphatases regulator n=1 Tax=Dacryopinax primogenitus (strain DJM 731) TaxID=1858805 RepID=M5GG56_DACPD|nr:uncharacterized protein DACRYDRAFT_47027 [Dacryopinax primogenitus]EJU04903.1 hypothetical protein DACRYDRAFT_47027 [Dacryopinax primogenitus]
MSYRTQTRIRSDTDMPSNGSRTLIIDQSQPREDSAEESGESSRPREYDGVLHLRGGPDARPHVVWSEDVIDNEGMGRKKSKICCIYHKPKPFDESSSEESDSSDSDSSGADLDRAKPSRRARKHRHHNHDPHRSDSGDSSGSGERARESGGTTVEELHDEPEPNAYERKPKPSKKDKAPGKCNQKLN